MNHFQEPKAYDDTETHALRESLVCLELPGVLEEVARFAFSAPGREQVFGAIPSTDLGEIRANLNLVAELREMVGLKGELGLGGLFPMEGILSKLESLAVILDAEEILGIADFLTLASVVRDRLLGLEERFTLLRQLGEEFIPQELLRHRIDQILDEHGMVHASASPRLMDIRERSRAVRRRIHGILDGIVRDRDLSRIVQEDYVTLRNDRYVVLLKPEFKGLLDGIVQDHSRSGASVYVEPLEVVGLNNQVASLMDEEREEIRRIFYELTGAIRATVPEISVNYALLARLDAFQARALYAGHTNGVFPELVDEGFHIQGARHPLLPTTDEGPVVPMDLIQEPSTLATVISGANMGGKTVALKIAGLFPLMVRCGIMLPAEEGSRIHAFARIMADIGEEQDIRSRVSSFSGHMLRIKAILDTASGGDLVLLDELGGATDPAEGSALAMGIMDELISRGTRVVVTTHLVHLKAYALGRSEVKNVSVEFHPQTLKPTFRLLYDLPGDSHAIATAERIGLPNSVIEAARKYVDAAAGGGSKLIQTLRDKIAEVEARRQELEQDQRELEEELSRTRSGREEILEEFRKEAQKLVRDAEKQISGLVRYLKSGQKKDYFKPHGELKRIKTELEQGLGTRLDKRAQLPPIGSTVHIKSIGKPGIVQALLDRGEVEVSAGKMKMRAAADDLIILAQAPEKKNSSKKKLVRVDIPITNARREVNVIGLRVDEALPVVDRAIDEAVLAGLTSLNVIHGKGTGRLKQAVWDHLSGHSLVKGVHSADLHLGGAGVTVVDLESG